MKPRPKKLLDQVRDALRLKHYSIRTENSYVHWIRRYILFHNKRHPNEMGSPEVQAFLTHLAVNEHVAASTQNQALSALLCLYREVLHKDLGPIDALRARKPKRLPTVLTKDEVHRVLDHLSGTHQLMAQLLYGSGLRLMECLRLRVKDIDFARRAIIVRDGKGMEDWVTMLPESLIAPLQEHLRHVKRLREGDLAKGYGAVYLPYALERKSPQRQPRVGLAVRLPLGAAVRGPPAAASYAATTWTKVACKRPSARPHDGPASPSPSAPIPSGIASPRTSWRMAMISAPYRNS